jgi:hypothetical protein
MLNLIRNEPERYEDQPNGEKYDGETGTERTNTINDRPKIGRLFHLRGSLNVGEL